LHREVTLPLTVKVVKEGGSAASAKPTAAAESVEK
jgi:hypothetical protein